MARSRVVHPSHLTTAAEVLSRADLPSAVMPVDMPKLDDERLARLAAICHTSKSPEFFAEVRNAVELAHFRERIRRYAQPFRKIANAAATLIRQIDALGPDARAMFEEILDKKNDIARGLEELAELHVAERAANDEYEQQAPLLFAFLKDLASFEYLSHWVAGLPTPYMLAPLGPGPLYIELAMDGKPVSSGGRRGRPRGRMGLSSGYRNLEIFVDHLTNIAAQSGGRLTYSDHHHSGTLVAALKLLRNHLPPDCRALPPKSTMRRIKERSRGHLYRLTPENLYGGPGLAARPEHHQAVIDAVRAVGVDPATVDPVDIACAAEIHAREGAPPDEAFPIAVVHGLISSGYIDRETAKKVLGDTVGSGRRTKPSKSAMRRMKERSSKK
jgi:hypothetical protein